ncbi:unnamed protein product [Moneuplotes crassus]|uniref:Uncharacterized protein n=1 Tax=Euplotes crassus TaxID=5936 RepID=A0AAD1UIX5_EUPCR|nr:unnamed protein product [Moneuplotes crassus]
MLYKESKINDQKSTSYLSIKETLTNLCIIKSSCNILKEVCS